MATRCATSRLFLWLRGQTTRGGRRSFYCGAVRVASGSNWRDKTPRSLGRRGGKHQDCSFSHVLAFEVQHGPFDVVPRAWQPEGGRDPGEGLSTPEKEERTGPEARHLYTDLIGL